MQRRISQHHRLDKGKVVTVDRILKLSSFFKRIDMRFQLGPAGEPVLTSDLKLSIRERASIARL
jgi:hypothetical protein